MALLQGPIVDAGGGSLDTLGMMSFTRYNNFGGNPFGAYESYNLMRGLHADGTPVHVREDPLEPVTRFPFSGDPVAGTGWLDDSLDVDRRLMINIGPFTMAVGDSQEIVAAVLVGAGPDRLASVADLREVHAAAVAAYRAGFDVPSDAPPAAFLLDADVEPDRVTLAWQVSDDAGAAGVVERRTPESNWELRGQAERAEGGVARYEDTAVTPGSRYAYRLLLGNGGGRTAETWVTIPGAPPAPRALTLLPARPNPASGSVLWRYYLPVAGRARLSVWDTRGRLVRELVAGDKDPGWHQAEWDGRDREGRDVASGTYFARVDAGGRAERRKIVLVR
jgi:hypothetical protein